MGTDLELPFEGLLDEAEQLLQARVPGLEEGAQLVQVGGLLGHAGRQVVGADEHYVVDIAALKQVAHGVRARAHPDV